MFDLSKDLDRYKGVTPYASEHYGVYKPLLGWRSALTKKWLLRGGPVGDPMVRSVLDGRIKPGPTGVINPHPLEFLAQPLAPGAGKTPWRVLIKKDLGSEIVGVIAGHLLTWLNDHAGAMPVGAEWTQVVDINAIMNANTGDMRIVNDIHRKRVATAFERDIAAGMAPDAALAKARQAHLSLMQFESQVATFLLAFAEAQEGAIRTISTAYTASRKRRLSMTFSSPPTRSPASIRTTRAARCRRSGLSTCSGNISSTSDRSSANRSSTSGSLPARRWNWLKCRRDAS